MVCKIKSVILFLIFAVLCFLNFNCKSNIEVNLVKTLLPKEVILSSNIVNLVNKTSSVVKVVFEAENEDKLEVLEQNFKNEIDENYFEYSKTDASKLISKYLSNSANFLSDKTKKLLLEERYDEIYANSISMLYNPFGFQISSLDKDPYLLTDDFLLSSQKISNKNNINNKFYSSLALKIKNNEGLSPDLSNKKIAELIKLQKKLSDKNNKIFLAGTPVHSYYTSLKSIVSINVICVLSTILIIFLTYFYFRNLKLLFPVAVSILFGMFLGYTATRLWFQDFQIITMVFSTTLIGIGIDYSYHYFFNGKINKDFIKNLTFSFLTTVIPFILLYFSNIELLKQVGIFSVFGLFGIYFAVLFIYPEIKINTPVKSIKSNDKIYKICLIMLIVFGGFGFLRFHFNDSLSSLYSPSKKLKKAEILYNKISNDDFQNAKIITIKGENTEDIIKKEENITSNFIKNDIEYVSLSKFIPSKDRQEENFKLVKKLYKNNLDKYSDILSKKQILALKNSTFKPVEFNIEEFPFLNNFMLDNNTSIVFISNDKFNTVENLAKDIKAVDFQSDVKNYMKKYRKLLLKLFPIAVLALIILLSILYNFKKAIKILSPSIIGILVSIGLNCLIYHEINLFSVIAIFLLIGFTIDYSIFRQGGKKQTEDAIIVSATTTSFSFLLLSLCNFKLLSSISSVLFFGIIVSYLAGKIIFKTADKLHDNI